MVCHISHFLSRLYANQRKPEVTWQNCKQTHLERTDGLLTVPTAPRQEMHLSTSSDGSLGAWPTRIVLVIASFADRPLSPARLATGPRRCLPAASASGVARGAKHQHQRTEERRGHQHPNSPLFVVYQRLNASAPNHSPNDGTLVPLFQPPTRVRALALERCSSTNNRRPPTVAHRHRRSDTLSA